MQPDSNTNWDVLVIGAGAAGLMAAWELALAGRRVAVMEARDRIGGRIASVQPQGFSQPVETGAEFVHGDLELTLSLLKKAGIRYYSLEGQMWRHHNGAWQEQKDFIENFPALKKKLEQVEEDMTVSDFLENHLGDPKWETLRFTLKNYVEGYEAADTNRASTLALRQDLLSSSGEQYRIEGGYQALMDYLFAQCREKNVDFFFDHPLQTLEWQPGRVTAHAAETTVHGLRVLITVPLGVLQQRQIKFQPDLPEYTGAAEQLGFGPVIKILLEFEKRFWEDAQYTGSKDVSPLQFIFSDEEVPTWWTAFPKHTPLLTGWLGGPHAQKHSSKSEADILQLALDSLSHIFNTEVAELRQWLKGSLIANWQGDDYSSGAYSYEVVNGNRAKNLLSRPVEKTIYFAGEALHHGSESGTVEAALQNGRETAHRIIRDF